MRQICTVHAEKKDISGVGHYKSVAYKAAKIPSWQVDPSSIPGRTGLVVARMRLCRRTNLLPEAPSVAGALRHHTL